MALPLGQLEASLATYGVRLSNPDYWQGDTLAPGPLFFEVLRAGHPRMIAGLSAVLLAEGVDWSSFAKDAKRYGLVNRTGYVLSRIRQVWSQHNLAEQSLQHIDDTLAALLPARSAEPSLSFDGGDRTNLLLRHFMEREQSDKDSRTWRVYGKIADTEFEKYVRFAGHVSH